MKHISNIIFYIVIGLLILGKAVPSMLAQTSQTFYIKAKLSPDNEVPPITGLDANGSARVKITVDRDTGGNITSGVAVFEVGYQFPSAVTLTGFHIHSAAVGVNGPVVINSGLTSTEDPDGVGSLSFTTPTLNTPEQLTALNGLVNTPQLFYINLHTTDNPAGVIRGQVTTETLFYKASLLPGNEVPPVTDVDASADVLITLDVTRDSNGNITSGAIMFDNNYRFPGAVTINGFHIHTGQAGENGPVVINSGVTSIDDPVGVGRITKIISLPTDEATLNTIKAVIANPEGHYVNMHTSTHPAGAVRGQLKDANQFTSIPFSRDDSSFRSNLGIQNLTDIPGRVLLRLSGEDGDIYEQSIEIPARGFTQILNVNPSLGNDETQGALKLDPDQHVEGFVSVIDNASNLPTVVPLAPKGTRLTIPSATNVGQFRSSLAIFNEGSQPATVDVIARGRSGAITGQKTGISISPNGFFNDVDILTTLGITDYGPLEIRSTNGQPISAISLVYNNADNRGSIFVGKPF
jgi:hypothetical protein